MGMILKSIKMPTIITKLLILLTCYASGFDLDSAIKEINDAPSWTGMTEENIGIEGSRLVLILNKYNSITTDQARKLVKGLIVKSKPVDGVTASLELGTYDIDIAGKIYIFNRLYCNVPTRADQDKVTIFGGWVGVVSKDESINILYPLETNDDGSLELKSTFGGYMGGPYRGLQEFEFLIENYGLRSKK